jgi:hypothetical protein
MRRGDAIVRRPVSLSATNESSREMREISRMMVTADLQPQQLREALR